MECKFIATNFWVLILLLLPVYSMGQLNHYWSNNFNDESALLAGAVVGGGAGPSSIYYNPATISEIRESKLSINASLYSVEFLKISDALGQGIDLNSSKSYVIPRFISYMIKPKNRPNWRLELAFLNANDQSFEMVNYTNKKIDILSKFEGEEDYKSTYRLSTKYRDDWIGLGGSYKLDDNLFLGTSMFISFVSQKFYRNLQINAIPQNPTITDLTNLFYHTSYQNEEEVKFNDYRVIWKFGLLYKKDRLSLGLNITAPSISGIYSDGKRIMRKENQSNISDPETGESIDDYLYLDYAEKGKVSVRAKSPFSVSTGLSYSNVENTRTLFLTIQYFAKINPYVTVRSKRKPLVTEGGGLASDDEFKYWLTFIDGAKPILNVGIGYKLLVKKNYMLLAGFKTDFNYKKNLDLNPYNNDLDIPSINFDKYHFTFGSTVNFMGQDITAGVQYSFGYANKLKQIANLSDPVEFNYEEQKALQGTRLKTMSSLYNTFSFYLAATFNFGGSDQD